MAIWQKSGRDLSEMARELHSRLFAAEREAEALRGRLSEVGENEDARLMHAENLRTLGLDGLLPTYWKTGVGDFLPLGTEHCITSEKACRSCRLAGEDCPAYNAEIRFSVSRAACGEDIDKEFAPYQKETK